MYQQMAQEDVLSPSVTLKTWATLYNGKITWANIVNVVLDVGT